MDLRQLEVFLAVADTLNFSRAAENLEVAQPAVSQTIQNLERSMGIQLFRRTNRKVDLTPAGEALIPRARALIDESRRVREEVRRTARGEIGRLRIGTMGAATHTILPDLVRLFRVTRPGVQVEVAEMTPTQQIAALGRGDIDLGFARRPPHLHAHGLLSQLVYVDELVACLSTFDPLATEDGPLDLSILADRDFVLFERREAPELVDLMIETCRSAGFSPKVVAHSRLMATVPLMVACGVGVSLVPASVRFLAQPGSTTRCLVHRSAPVPLVVMAKQAPARLVRDFLLHVEDHRPEIGKQMEISPCPIRTAEALNGNPPLSLQNLRQ